LNKGVVQELNAFWCSAYEVHIALKWAGLELKTAAKEYKENPKDF
jgi:hypothetical protein